MYTVATVWPLPANAVGVSAVAVSATQASAALVGATRASATARTLASERRDIGGKPTGFRHSVDKRAWPPLRLTGVRLP